MSTTIAEQAVHVPAGEVSLDGDLGLPEGARGIVLFLSLIHI